MSKKKNTPLNIFMESVGLYFSNFDKFVKYMTFPVLGQIAGLGLVFLLTFFYAKNMPMLMQKIPALNSLSVLLATILLLILPGMIIFVKAFWEYLVAYGAINSMTENMLKSGKVYDFDAHTELIKRRTIPFVGLWFLFGIYSLIALCPLMWVICAVFAIFFVLVFQVFTYEPEQTPFGCVQKSFMLIKGHFASTFMLFALIGALTYVLIPQLVGLFFEYTNITMFFAKMLVPFVEIFPINDWNSVLTSLYMQPLKIEDITTFVVTTCIAQIFIQYTLPMRSILWAMWYRKLNGGFNSSAENLSSKTRSKKSAKKPSEKLMQESHKKYASKKIDRNILRRAMEKDDE